jgi:hypothetical protein
MVFKSKMLKMIVNNNKSNSSKRKSAATAAGPIGCCNEKNNATIHYL